MSVYELEGRPHAWCCPVVMKTAPDYTAFTCGRCGAITTVIGAQRPDPGTCAGTVPCVAALTLRSPASEPPQHSADGETKAARRSPNCLYLGDPVTVWAGGPAPQNGTIVAFCGPLVEISSVLWPGLHAESQMRRRVPWDTVRGVPPPRG